MKPGDRVEDPTWGPGVVRQLRDGGRALLVAFDKAPKALQIVKTLSVRLLSTADAAAEPASPNPAFALTVPTRSRTADAAPVRQALEALRLGVVPPTGLDALTVGRAGELASLQRLLAAGRGMRLVSGEFGSGKSHLLELVEAHALAAGFAVARATFDPVEVPPSHPLRIYAALMAHLRWPGSSGLGLRPLMETLAESVRHREPDGERFHRWLSPALWAASQDAETAATAIEWVEGAGHAELDSLNRRFLRGGWTGPSLLALPDYRTFGQIMASLLGAVAAWSRDAGYRGLVVLLDEAEYLDRMVGQSREMAENVLRYLAVATLDDAELAFRPDSIYRGGHAVHRGVNPRFEADQPLIVLATFTPNPELSAVLGGLVADHRLLLPLDPLSPRTLSLLSDRVLDLVQQVYPTLSPTLPSRRAIRDGLNEALESGAVQSTRQAARMVLTYWDLYRRSPELAAAALAGR